MRSTVLTFTANVDPARRYALDEALRALAARVAEPPRRPFSDIPQLHFASAVVFDTPGFPPLLVFEHNFDGPLGPYLVALLKAASADVYAMFSCCADFARFKVAGPDDRDGLAVYLRAHCRRPAAYHVGNVGRSRERIAREAALHADLNERIDRRIRGGWQPKTADEAYRAIHQEMRAAGEYSWVSEPHKRQTLLERALPWLRIAGVVILALGALVAVGVGVGRATDSALAGALVPVALLVAVVALLIAVLRRHERRDVPMDPADVDAAHIRRLETQEDVHRQNHLASVTVVKRSLFRRLTLRVVLWAANLVARTSTKGTLSGIPTIHFAHWALLDGGRRLLFLSNYGGSWGSYLDDFVDKASIGLTAIWTNTEGFPRTELLVRKGARDGAAFKAFARMQQAPAAVWYGAAPYHERGLTVRQIDVNSALREGLAARPPAVEPWLRLWGPQGGRPAGGRAPVAPEGPHANGPLDKRDMQGLLVSAFAHLPCAAYRLLRVTDATQARAWLAERVPLVTTSEAKQEGWSLNVALTLEGLAALGLPPDAVATFPAAMHAGGMASPRRSRILGDTGRDAPARWRWGGPTTPVHVLLLVYAADETELARQLAAHIPGPGAGLAEVLTLVAGRPRDNREHFGFVDGVGQPVVEGSGRKERQLDRTGHATEIAAGEFVLGYRNADAVLPLSPTVAAASDPTGILGNAPRRRDRRDLGRSGSYLVFRQMRQDVASFWDGVRAEAEMLWPGDPDGPTRLASKMVGRWLSGAPLVLDKDADPFGGKPQERPRNDFDYAHDDPQGLACPLGAHIRRSNPRDALGPDAKTARASANRHRLLRRGRAYGDRAPEPLRPDEGDRGLHFICLGADLERQFEFVQQTWLNNPGFAGVSGEVDPLTGPTATAGGPFSVQQDPLRLRACGLRAHVTIVGGAYFFLPGVRALRFITSLPG